MQRRKRPAAKTTGAPLTHRRLSKTRSSSYASPEFALLLLTAARGAGAAVSIVHDCDEVFNYWEPLHNLIYGYGMQTWEYSSAFALRSWWYIILHAVIGAPAAVLFDSANGKVAVFYIIKATLALLSALTEWWLYKAVSSKYSATLSNSLLVMLCMSSGMFAAAPALLPSSFTMYAVTAAAAALLSGNSVGVIVPSVIGVIWGWCVAGIAFVPYAFWILSRTRLLHSVGVLLTALMGTLVPLVLADKIFYGTWKASLWNFIQYNVAGGGQSALYGVEPPLYYFRNGFNQLQFALPLALLMPLLAVIARWGVGAHSNGQEASKASNSSISFGSDKHIKPKLPDGTLFIAVSPFFLWLASISVLPHKEERFLYVVYPLIYLAAAATLDLVHHGVRTLLGGGSLGRSLARACVVLAVSITALLSLSRSMALVWGYGAPTQVYRTLPIVKSTGAGRQRIHVCIGAEWYRFPSAFFLPGPEYRLQFIKSGFNGLLPAHFDDSMGGTRAAPPQLNDQNRSAPENYWETAEKCDYVVTLGPNLEDSGENNLFRWIDAHVLGSPEDWEVLAEGRFIDSTTSPALTRAFFIPGVSTAWNTWQRYVLLKRSRHNRSTH